MSWNYYRHQNSNKYKNQKIFVDGIQFDSKKEARRYEELMLLEKSGDISDLQRQVKYILIPTQREPDEIGKRGGIKKGKVIERECTYVADFVYKDAKSEEVIVEDTKSPATRTESYIIKRKLMLKVHGIRIHEI